MPALAPVIGVEFEAISVSNGDGGALTLFVTVVNAQDEFTVRLVQTGPSSGVFTITKPGGTQITFDLATGERVLIRRQDNNAIGMPWTDVARKFCIQGGART